MPKIHRCLSLVPFFLLFLSAVTQAAQTGVETLGSARFTVITPQLIRIEYAEDGKFIDAASWFAKNRDVRDTDYKAQNDGHTLTIDTGIIRLTYTNSGHAFDDDNLKAEIKSGSGTKTWKPSSRQTANLGGTVTGLDRVRQAIPLDDGVVSRDGWFLYDDSGSVLRTSDWYQERPQGHGTDWYLYGYGLDYKAAIKSLTTISGAIPLPRKATFGMWYSRNFPYSEDEFKQIVTDYHTHDFPLDIIVMDYGWHIKGWTGYTWNADKIPDPDGLLQWYHQQGLTVTVNDHPDGSVQPAESKYADFMKAMGQDPASGNTIRFNPVDKRYLDTFYQYTHIPLIKQGIDFWWLDYGEPPPLPEMPSLSPLALMNEYNFESTGMDGRRGQSFSRWGGWGGQRSPINFSGDVDTGWRMLAFEIPFSSTGGNAGAFFWSHDIGGYRGGRHEEDYARWCQWGALSAALRTHSAGNADMDRRPWLWPDWATDSMRRSFHLRASLMPYVYTSAQEAVKSSVPFIRPMYLDHPQEEAAYHNGQQFYLGDNLLAAPIVSPGQGANHVGWQHVWFPGGTWYQYFTGEKYSAKGDAVVAADLNELPLFARAGVPLPEQPYTERPTSAPLSNLVLRCFPGADGATGTSQLYEDDGVSDDYKKGGFATTQLTYTRRGDTITVRVAPAQGSYQGQVTSRSYTILLPGTQQATLLAPSNGKLTYDAATGINRIDLPVTAVSQGAEVKVTAADLDPQQVSQAAAQRRLDGLLGKPFAQAGDTEKAGVALAARAIQGTALMVVNQDPYTYGDDVKLVYYDSKAQGPITGKLSYKSWSAPVTVTSGQPIDFSAAISSIPPEDTIRVPGSPNNFRLELNGNSSAYTADVSDLIAVTGDLAFHAKVNVNRAHYEGINDGVADGEPGDPINEWFVKNGKKGGWVKLTWGHEVKATRVLLYDRPNLSDQVLAGKLTFSDGSSVEVGELPNDGKTPANITFPEKTITWVRFDITQVSPKTGNEGLSEMAVFDR